MNRRWIGIILLFALMTGDSPATARNILGDLIKVYSTYQEVNMLLWLSGDAKAERRFGEEVKWYINLTNKKEKDPEANRWVRSVFDRVKTQFRDRGFDYNLTLLKGDTVNAFAIPGGSIFVYTGMLKFVGSDDELAAILAHELAHSERRHSLKQLRQSTAFQLLMQKAVKNRRDQETWGQVVGALTMLQFSRQDEDEADDLGQQKMFAAGFNPAAQVVVWEKFVQKFGRGESGILQYLSTHPPSQARVENARKNLVNMQVPENRSFPLSYNVLSDTSENLLQNGSFETDLQQRGFPDAWTIKEGKGRLAPTVAFTGRNSVELAADLQMRPVRVVSELIPIQAGQSYLLTGAVKTAGGTQRVSLGAEVYDRNKRLRGFIWPILSGATLPAQWKKVEGTLAFGATAGKNLPADAAFIKILLQNGPLSKGAVWFDDFVLRRTSSTPPANLLAGGDFEVAGTDGVPDGVTGEPARIARDTDKFKTGYASLRIQGKDGQETAVEFAPIPLTSLKEGQELQGSFHFVGNGPLTAHLQIDLLDEAGNPLSRRLLDREFIAKRELWQSTGFRARYTLEAQEKDVAKALSVRIAGSIPATGTLWLDGMILR